MAAPSPAVAHRRAKVGGLSRGRAPDDTELVDAKRNLAEAKISDYLEKVLNTAPPLTDEQRTRLAELLRPVRVHARNGGDSDAA